MLRYIIYAIIFVLIGIVMGMSIGAYLIQERIKINNLQCYNEIYYVK